MQTARAEFEKFKKQKGVTGLLEQETHDYRKDVRKTTGDYATLGSHVSHI